MAKLRIAVSESALPKSEINKRSDTNALIPQF